MNVLLFDHATIGHHLEYAGHIARYLRQEGDRVTFGTSQRLPDSTLSSSGEDFDDVVYLDDPDATHVTGWRWNLSTFRGARRALEHASRRSVDVVHFTYLDRSEIAVLTSLAWRGRRPAVFGTMFWSYFMHDERDRISLGKRLFHDASLSALGRLLAGNLMDALFVHSERMKSVLATRLPKAAGSKIVVVPDPAKEAPAITKEQARTDLGVPLNAPLILMFGDTRVDKGPDILLRALPLLKGDWIAAMVGEPVIVSEKEAEACRLTLKDPSRLITRFRYIPEPEADRWFRAADVIVLPYRRIFKGTSGVLRRAAASGKPLVATDVGDVGPTVIGAGLGIVIPAESHEHLAAGLQEFLDRSEEIQRQVEPRALAYAAANDWRILGAATRKEYLAAVSHRRGGRLQPAGVDRAAGPEDIVSAS